MGAETVMSRIADAVQKYRREHGGRAIDPLHTRLISHVDVPWAIEMPAPVVEPAPPAKLVTTPPPPRPQRAAGPTLQEVARPEIVEPQVVAGRDAERRYAELAESIRHRDDPHGSNGTKGPEPLPVQSDREQQANTEILNLARKLFLPDGSRKAPVNRVLFTALDGSNSAADVAARLAEALATLSDRSICLADLDFRRPTLDLRYGLGDVPGFLDPAATTGPLHGCTHRLAEHANLWVMPSGAVIQEVSLILQDPDTKPRLTEVLAAFTYAIAFTSPITVHDDASALGSLFDGVVLVAVSSITKPEVVRTAAESLERAHVPLLGTILDNRASPGVA
jgi:Mrp family chromosome partitioning ATPase